MKSVPRKCLAAFAALAVLTAAIPAPAGSLDTGAVLKKVEAITGTQSAADIQVPAAGEPRAVGTENAQNGPASRFPNAIQCKVVDPPAAGVGWIRGLNDKKPTSSVLNKTGGILVKEENGRDELWVYFNDPNPMVFAYLFGFKASEMADMAQKNRNEVEGALSMTKFVDETLPSHKVGDYKVACRVLDGAANPKASGLLEFTPPPVVEPPPPAQQLSANCEIHGAQTVCPGPQGNTYCYRNAYGPGCDIASGGRVSCAEHSNGNNECRYPSGEVVICWTQSSNGYAVCTLSGQKTTECGTIRANGPHWAACIASTL